MESDSVEPITQALHQLTCYDPSQEWDGVKDDPRLVRDFTPNDMTRLPFFTKRYGPLPHRTPMPRELPLTTSPTLAVLAGTARPAAAPLDLAGLGRLLHLSAGVVRTMDRDYGTHLFRAAGSAGGRFPLEVYVAIPGGDPVLPPGVHWYDPVDHALVQVGPAPRPGSAAPTVVVTGVPWRTGWRYRERGFRHVYWDAGTMLSQLLALADSAGLEARLVTRFPDADVSALVGADQVHEWPVALVALGAGAPATEPGGPAAAGEVDSAPLEFPLVTAAQHAGDERAGDPGAAVAPWVTGASVDVPAGDPAPLDAIIVRRGSQRQMDPGRWVPLDTLRTAMAVALRGISIDHWVAVHDVAGLAPGIYRWPDLGRPLRQGSQEEMRAELYRVCLEQSLARDAAFVVIAATDVSRLSDREYREAQLAAGIVEGRLHLAAYALGASATGMTFLDSEIPALLGEPRADGLLFTCVGVPAYTSRPGGLPGAPTAVRRVSPRA